MYYVNILQGNKSDSKKLKISSFNQSVESASDESLELSHYVLQTWFAIIGINFRHFLTNFEDGNNNFQFTCSTEEYEKLCLLYKLEQL